MPRDSSTHYFLVFDRDDSRRLPLPQDGELVVGRAEQADLRVRDTSVSRRHARVIVSRGEVAVEDLESHNGVLINGVPIAKRTRLGSQDIVTLGKVAMVYQAAAGPTGSTDLVTADRTTEGLARREITGAGRRYELGDEIAVVADPGMVRVYTLLERLANAAIPVLLVGETGSGKRLAASALHHLSRRNDRPMLALDAVDVEGGDQPFPDNATTVLIDDVAELSPAAQARVLRVLEARRARTEPSDAARIVAATRRDLEEEVQAGRFREDLYFRLGAATVWIPPLRDRTGEIPVLANRFLDEARRQMGRTPQTLSTVTLRALALHTWPGNIGELRQAMEFASATAPGGVIEPDHLPARVLGRPAAPAGEERGAPVPLEAELRALEKRRMEEALATCAGNQTRAAALLGMPRRTFVAKLRQYEIERRRKAD